VWRISACAQSAVLLGIYSGVQIRRAYPFGSQIGNAHARTLFRQSPAAARMAKDLGRDLGRFMTRLEAAEAGEGIDISPRPPRDRGK
jgi:hypothetical protein